MLLVKYLPEVETLTDTKVMQMDTSKTKPGFL